MRAPAAIILGKLYSMIASRVAAFGDGGPQLGASGRLQWSQYDPRALPVTTANPAAATPYSDTFIQAEAAERNKWPAPTTRCAETNNGLRASTEIARKGVVSFHLGDPPDIWRQSGFGNMRSRDSHRTQFKSCSR